MTAAPAPMHADSTEAAPPQRLGRPWRPSRFLRLLLSLGAAVRIGAITVTLPDGTQRRFGGVEPGPEAALVIHRDRMAKRFFLGGMLGFCESYLDGDWSTPDMEALFGVTLANERALSRLLDGKPLMRMLALVGHVLRPNSKSGSRRNIAYHYDLGNDFYAAWLDETMTYSSALFAAPDEDMVAAQRRKYEALADRLDLQPGHRLLEIGCGWGGFAEYAARERQAEVTAITISAEQHAYAVRRIAEAGLNDRVRVILCDYRDVPGRFDRVASIEMFEAVGERYWPVFFGTLRDRLVAGGRAALQIITIEDGRFPFYRRSPDYIQRYIFPGGMLPSPSVLQRHVTRAGLRWLEDMRFGEHYARTLAEWNARFQAAWPRIAPLGFDDRFKRMWEQYLAYCAAGFRAGTIDVMQLSLTRD